MNQATSAMRAAAASSEVTHDRAWRRALVWLALAIGWILVWYWQTASAMVYIWYRSETFAHCFLVAPISLWLIWRKRDDLRRIRPQPNLAFGLILLAAAALWLLGDLAAVNAATQLAFVLTLILSVPAILGTAVAGEIAFPLLFLLFAVPIGEFAMPQMMQWTAQFTVFALRLTGIPVYQEGLQFVIPSGSWSVVEACSGIRYLIASTVVGTLFAYLNYSSLKRRLIFVGISILVPIVANWLRAYLIVALGHYSSNTLAVGADHLIYGWFFFGLVIIAMFMIGARWAEAPRPAPAGRPNDQARQHGRKESVFWPVALLVALVMFLPHGANWALDRVNRAAVPTLRMAPSDALQPWMPVPAISDWRPAFKNASAEYSGAFAHDGRQVGLHVAYYRNQDYEHKLVSSDNVLVRSDDRTWALVSNGPREIGFGEAALPVRAAEIRRSAAGPALEERLDVISFYWIGGRLVIGDAKAKLLTALSRLRADGDDSALVVVYAPKRAGEGKAAIESFTRANGKALLAALQSTRDRR